MTFRSIALLPLLLTASLALAESATAPDTTPASAPASAAHIAAKETETLKAAVGKQATVYGTVTRVQTSTGASGITFIDFSKTRGDFTGIIKKEDKEAVEKGFDNDLAKALKGKEIEITGTLTDYKGAPQIEIRKPDQVKVVEKK